MADQKDQREKHVLDIISKPLAVVEAEHGVWGLDYLVEVVLDRRFAAVQELQANRDKPE